MQVLDKETGMKLKAELEKAEQVPRYVPAWNSSNTLEEPLRFLPGHKISVQLRKCGHRARVEALSSGAVPARAQCPKCHRWRNTIPHTARKPIPKVTRDVVAERTEVRDGRAYTVTVLKTPRRAQKARLPRQKNLDCKR
jgi:hypothetical protein